MKKFVIYFLLFAIVSCLALLAMKYILWALFTWGGIGAITLASVFTCFYIGSFFVIAKKWKQQEHGINILKWIWILGFAQLAVLGVFYHLLPQFFPAIIADFFFA